MKKEYGAFAEHFVSTFAPEILSTYLEQVDLFVTGKSWLSKKCQYQIFQFFTEWYVLVFTCLTSRVLSFVFLLGLGLIVCP